MIQPHELVIDDTNWQAHYTPPVVNGHLMTKGLIPRDYTANPVGSYRHGKPFHAINIPLIPRNNLPDIIKDMEANKSRLSDIRRVANGGKPIPSLDQNGVGYCWNHSTTMAVMLTRAIMNQPYVRLSAFMIGCLVKNYRDEGGWGALSMDFAIANGIPAVQFWPEKSMNRSNDTPEMRANAKLHVVVDGFIDTAQAEYDRNLSEDQICTLLAERIPVVGDFNWWSHSVCVIDLTLSNSGENMMRYKSLPNLESLDMNNPKDRKVFGDIINKRIINSWTDSWGDMGEGVLAGTKAHLDGAVAPRRTLATAT